MIQGKLLVQIYWIFFKMSAVTFGGGYAMLPILQREISKKRAWTNDESLVNFYALSQALPGIIAVNVSVFIGHQKAGFWGGAAAALGVISPCMLVIMVLAAGLSQVIDNLYVQRALAGMSVCVSALILHTVVGLWKQGVCDRFGFILCLAVFGGTLLLQLSPVFYMLAAAVLGVLRARRGGTPT